MLNRGPRKLAPFALCLLGAVTMIAMALPNRASWNVDFNQYYAAGKLAGTGHLYDRDAIRAIELEHHQRCVPFGRMPFYAMVFKALAVLPYDSARSIFLLIEICAAAGCLFLWKFDRSEWFSVLLCWSLPLAICLAFGQDSILILFFISLGWYLLHRKRDFAAGIAFAVCASKPHMALLLPVLVVARGRWKTMLGGAAGVAAITAISFAAEGRDWPSQLLALARIPEFDPAAARMPNLRGLLTVMGGGLAVEVTLGLLVAAAVFVLSRRLPLRPAVAMVLSAALLVSHHAYIYDCVLLIPALQVVVEHSYAPWLRTWALFLLTPLPYLLLLTDRPVAGNIAISGYVIAFLIASLFQLARADRAPTASRRVALTTCPSAH